jgi:hypothetical protein
MPQRKRSQGGVCAALRKCLGPGVVNAKGAIVGSDRSKIDVTDGTRFDCSVNLDALFYERYPTRSRWDYLLVVRNGQPRLVAVEVHEATAGAVKEMVAKRTWALETLRAVCGAEAPGVTEWHWVASGRVYLRPTDPQFHVLQRSGINSPKRVVTL